jgi:hypothetical protein
LTKLYNLDKIGIANAVAQSSPRNSGDQSCLR